MKKLPEPFLRTFAQAIDSAQQLWILIFDLNRLLGERWQENLKCATIDYTDLLTSGDSQTHNLIEQYLDIMADHLGTTISIHRNNNVKCITVSSILRYNYVAPLIFGHLFSRTELFAIGRFAIRNRNKLYFNDRTITYLSHLSSILNELLPLDHSIEASQLYDLLDSRGIIPSNVKQAFIEILVLEKVIVRSSYDPRSFQRKGYIYYFYITNRLFGLLFEIPGFNFLFENGMLVPQEHGLSMLISGGAGSGKTTLSLQLAAEIAKQGGCSLYFSAEQEVSSLQQSMVSFSWNNEFKMEVINRMQDLNKHTAEPSDGRGLLLLCPLSKWNFQDSLSTISNILNSVKNRSWHNKRLIVIDSLSAINLHEGNANEGKGSNFSKKDDPICPNDLLYARSQIERLFVLVKENRFWGIYIREQGYQNEITKMCEYLSDTLINLSIAPDRDDYSIRRNRSPKFFFKPAILDGTSSTFSDNRKVQHCEKRTISLRSTFCEDSWTSGKPSLFSKPARRRWSRHSWSCMPG